MIREDFFFFKSVNVLSSALFLVVSAHAQHSRRYQGLFSYLHMEPNILVESANQLPQT